MTEPQPTPEFRRGQIHVTFRNCARCGGEHERIVCAEFTNPCGEFTHYTTCPKNGEPILVKVVHEMDVESSTKPSPPPNPKVIEGERCGNWDFVPLRGATQCPGKLVKDGDVLRCDSCRMVYKEDP